MRLPDAEDWRIAARLQAEAEAAGVGVAVLAVGTWVFSHFPVIDMIAGVLFKRPPSP